MPGLMLVGADHAVFPLDVRERVAITGPELPAVLGQLGASVHVREVFVLSSFHQTEVYLRGHSSALDDVQTFWEQRTAVASDGAGAGISLYEKRDEDAAYHLFLMSAGLDLALPARAQALAQVQQSLAAARDAGTVGEFLDPLLQRALRVARRIRRDLGPEPDAGQLEQAMQSLRKEAERFIHWARSRRATTAITALKQRAEQIRRAELLKMQSKLTRLSPEEREALEALTTSIVNKLLHPSQKALQGAAELGEVSDYLRAASELFDLEEP